MRARMEVIDRILGVAESNQVDAVLCAGDLFDSATVRRFGEHYLTLLGSIVADPERPISRLPVLSEEERNRLLVEWNRTEPDSPAAGPPAGRSVHEYRLRRGARDRSRGAC